jgi:LysR family transcriptional regulator for bpeEF and oprC
MDRFQAMQVFTRVVDANSFTAAADLLGLPRTTVTTTIQALERQLQVRLLNRTTRKLSLTPDGAVYYERCVRILADVEESEAAFRDITRGPRGRLRIDTVPALGKLVLIPRICDFHSRYPDIDLMIGLSDRPVDLVQEAVDCAIRVGELQDSSLIARRIGTLTNVTCAAPAYLDMYGEPKSIEDLDQHRAVHYFSSRTGRRYDWEFNVGGVLTPVKVNGSMSVNDGEAYVACGLQGLGLIQPPRFMVQTYLQSGQLREVLPQMTPTSMPISAVYLQNRHLSPKVRVFVDWLAEIFSGCSLLGGTDGLCGECHLVGGGGLKTVRELVEQKNIAESVL